MASSRPSLRLHINNPSTANPNATSAQYQQQPYINPQQHQAQRSLPLSVVPAPLPPGRPPGVAGGRLRGHTTGGAPMIHINTKNIGLHSSSTSISAVNSTPNSGSTPSTGSHSGHSTSVKTGLNLVLEEGTPSPHPNSGSNDGLSTGRRPLPMPPPPGSAVGVGTGSAPNSAYPPPSRPSSRGPTKVPSSSSGTIMHADKESEGKGKGKAIEKRKAKSKDQEEPPDPESIPYAERSEKWKGKQKMRDLPPSPEQSHYPDTPSRLPDTPLSAFQPRTLTPSHSAPGFTINEPVSSNSTPHSSHNAALSAVVPNGVDLPPSIGWNGVREGGISKRSSNSSFRVKRSGSVSSISSWRSTSSLRSLGRSKHNQSASSSPVPNAVGGPMFSYDNYNNSTGSNISSQPVNVPAQQNAVNANGSMASGGAPPRLQIMTTPVASFVPPPPPPPLQQPPAVHSQHSLPQPPVNSPPLPTLTPPPPSTTPTPNSYLNQQRSPLPQPPVFNHPLPQAPFPSASAGQYGSPVPRAQTVNTTPKKAAKAKNKYFVANRTSVESIASLAVAQQIAAEVSSEDLPGIVSAHTSPYGEVIQPTSIYSHDIGYGYRKSNDSFSSGSGSMSHSGSGSSGSVATTTRTHSPPPPMHSSYPFLSEDPKASNYSPPLPSSLSIMTTKDDYYFQPGSDLGALDEREYEDDDRVYIDDGYEGPGGDLNAYLSDTGNSKDLEDVGAFNAAPPSPTALGFEDLLGRGELDESLIEGNGDNGLGLSVTNEEGGLSPMTFGYTPVSPGAVDILGEELEMVFSKNPSPTRREREERYFLGLGAGDPEERVFIRGRWRDISPDREYDNRRDSSGRSRGSKANGDDPRGRKGRGIGGLRRYQSEENLIDPALVAGSSSAHSASHSTSVRDHRARTVQGGARLTPNRYVEPNPAPPPVPMKEMNALGYEYAVLGGGVIGLAPNPAVGTGGPHFGSTGSAGSGRFAGSAAHLDGREKERENPIKLKTDSGSVNSNKRGNSLPRNADRPAQLQKVKKQLDSLGPKQVSYDIWVEQGVAATGGGKRKGVRI